MPRDAHFLSRLLLCLVLLPLALPALAGCQNQIKVSDRNLVQLQYPQLQALLEENEKSQVVLVDVRKKEAFDQGHIPGAINIFLPDIVASEPRLAKAQHIVVYSQGWTDPLSRAAGKRLLALGYEGVSDFRGGIEAWQTEGRMLAVTLEKADTPQPQ